MSKKDKKSENIDSIKFGKEQIVRNSVKLQYSQIEKFFRLKIRDTP